jgi:hypothetical protein
MPDGACGLNIIVTPPLVLCAAPNEMFNGKCVPPCPPGQVHKMPDGACGLNIAIPPGGFCFPPKEVVNGACVDPCPPLQVRKPDGTCGLPVLVKPPVLPVVCLAPKEIFNGKCVDKCPADQVHKMPNGECGPKLILQPPVIKLPPAAKACGGQGQPKCGLVCPPGQHERDGACVSSDS